jgi:chromosome segregation ATPase
MTIEESLARKIKHCDEITEERDQALKERDEARDEVARLRELLDENAYERGLLARRMTEAQARRDEAYRRGAEAMREACVATIHHGERDEARKLVDALRASGLTTDDCRAVETLYAVAGHAGSHRIVEAMRYLGAWLRALPIPEES